VAPAMRVPPVRLIIPTWNEGAPGPSHLGTGDGAPKTSSTTNPGLEYPRSARKASASVISTHHYDFNVDSHQKFVEKLRCIHRNPVKRGLALKPEDWRWSNIGHSKTGVCEPVAIESGRAARKRSWQLPAWMLHRLPASPSPVPNREGPWAPSTV
jgi:hypothetical protein